MLETSECLMYADDTVIYAGDHSKKVVRKRLQKDLYNVEKWCDANRLSLNVNKTKVMTFMSDHRRKTVGKLRLCMKGKLVEEVDNYKYLGTTLDNRLSGDSQYSKLLQSLGLKLRTFGRIRRFLNTNAALTVYKSTILPIIDYNDMFQLLWNFDKLDRLQKLQNRALRTVYSDKDPQLDEQGLHAEADILLLKQRRVLHLLNLMFHRSKKDVYLDKRQMPTRQFDKIKFKVIAPQVKKAFRSPNYLGAQLWDALPLDTQTSPTFGLFKSRVIRHIAAGMFNG